MDNTRIIPVRFGKERLVVTEYRMQHDWGQVLDFIDIPLPEAFEARFSNSVSGQSVGQIGYNNRVRIPKQFFESGEPIYCYITLHDEETDGRTLYTTKVPIKPSSERTEEEPEPEEESIITQAITALNTAVDVTSQKALEASESADRAEHAADGIEAYVERAEAAQQASESARDRAVQAETNSSASASIASEKASEAYNYADVANKAYIATERYASIAEGEAGEAKRYAEASAESASQANGYASTAGSKATEASGYASNANISAETASQKASEAAQSASTAVQAKTDAETAKQASETAQGLAETARNEAVTAKESAESARDEAQEIVDGITGKVEEIDSNTDRIESLEDDRYKPYAVDTASGSIASFPDGADNIPLKSCIVRVEPVQDLHGYDSPWPAGGGKNLWSNDKAFMYTGKKTFTFESPIMKANETYTISGTLDIDDDRYTSLVMFYGPPSGSYTANVDITEGTFASTFSPKVDVYRLSFYATRSGATNQGVTASFDFFQLESGSTATSYAPYENICPISGWTACKVWRAGINIWDEQTKAGTFNNSTGAHNPNRLDIICMNTPIKVTPSTSYYLAFPSDVAAGNVYFYDSDMSFLSMTYNNANKVVTTPSGCGYVNISFGAVYGSTYNHDISINYPSTDHDYHPYTGRTYPITFPSEAGTVYGAYVDVTGGKLVVDRAYEVLNNPDKWSETSGTTNFRYGVSFDSRKIYDNSYSGLTCSYVPCLYGAEPYGRWNSSSGTDFCIKSSTLTLDQVKADSEAGKISIVYELAEPIHYTLTPTEIKTLLGQNNLWADTGDTEVEYRADTTLYISRLTEPDANMIADSNIVLGQYFMVGNNLYRATVNIASGASVIVGTNAVKVSLAQALNEINA